MIFKTYGELMDYVISTYPYQKIITYCQDLGYKFVDLDGYRTNSTEEFTESNISYLLRVAMSYYYRHFILDSIDQNKWTSEQKVLADICIASRYYASNYFSVYLRDSKEIVITFKFKYIGDWKFVKYNSSLPKAINSRWGDPRTKVVMKFKEDVL